MMRLVKLKDCFFTDSSRPDGVLVKRLEGMCLLALGWLASIGLEEGLDVVINWAESYRNSFKRVLP